MSIAALDAEGPPGAKKFKMDMADLNAAEVKVDPRSSLSPSSSSSDALQGESVLDGQSPAGPSSARSNGSVVSNSSATYEKDDDNEPLGTQANLLELISKSLIGANFKMEEIARPTVLPHSLSTSPAPPANVIPGALAVAQSPAARLFSDDDWSWHRNPAASIRSGGTNKQTPVWKYFVYNKAENLSRCIVGECTYVLKGPHTSTLACHLKKHPVEYSEFQKLKVDYTKERHGAGMPTSPSSSSTSCGIVPVMPTPVVSTPPSKPKPKKEPKDIGAQMSAAMRNNAPQMPPAMPNLMQNLLGMNPLQLMMSQQIPTSSSGMAAAQFAASQMLQQAGLSMGQNGQILPSKKWRRDERRQRELESRLALALASSQLSMEQVLNPLWKEFLEAAQPKFSMPDDVDYLDQLINTHHARMAQSIRAQLSNVRKMSLLVDAVRISQSKTDDSSIRLCVAVAFPAFASQKLETLLLAFRPIPITDNVSEAISDTIEQVMADYDIGHEKIFRVVCSGFKKILEDDDGSIVDKQMESFQHRLLELFLSFLEVSPQVGQLRRAVVQMIVSFASQPDNLQALNKITGGPVDLPLTEPFPVLAEAVLKIKDAVDLIASEGKANSLSHENWRLLQGVHNAAMLFQNNIHSGFAADIATADTVIPTIKHLLTALDKDAMQLGSLASELKEHIEMCLSSILDVNADDFDGTFVQATALNPQLAVLLNEQQIAFAKKAIGKQIQSRCRGEVRPRMPLGVDAILANVMEAAGSEFLASNKIYGDILQQARERMQQDQRQQEQQGRDRMAEAVVTSYFDEVLSGCSVESLLSRAFGNPFQTPLVYWQSCAAKCPALSELAFELLSVPSSTVSSHSVLNTRIPSVWSEIDSSVVVTTNDRPDVFERNLILRFNRNLLPKNY